MILRYDSYYDPPDYPDYTELPRRRVNRARKSFTCGVCGRPILQGTAYYRQVWVDEDHKLQTFRHHISFCEDVPLEDQR